MSTTLDHPDACEPVADGATLEVEYTRDGAVLRVTSGPDDIDAGARLLCAGVAHVRRRHAARAHTALDLGRPAAAPTWRRCAPASAPTSTASRCAAPARP